MQQAALTKPVSFLENSQRDWLAVSTVIYDADLAGLNQTEATARLACPAQNFPQEQSFRRRLLQAVHREHRLARSQKRDVPQAGHAYPLSCPFTGHRLCSPGGCQGICPDHPPVCHDLFVVVIICRDLFDDPKKRMANFGGCCDIFNQGFEQFIPESTL